MLTLLRCCRCSVFQVIIALWLVSMLLFAPLLWVLQTQPVDLGPQLAEAVEFYGLKFCVENWTKPDFSKKVYGEYMWVPWSGNSHQDAGPRARGQGMPSVGTALL